MNRIHLWGFTWMMAHRDTETVVFSFLSNSESCAAGPAAALWNHLRFSRDASIQHIWTKAGRFHRPIVIEHRRNRRRCFAASSWGFDVIVINERNPLRMTNIYKMNLLFYYMWPEMSTWVHKLTTSHRYRPLVVIRSKLGICVTEFTSFSVYYHLFNNEDVDAIPRLASVVLWGVFDYKAVWICSSAPPCHYHQHQNTG